MKKVTYVVALLVFMSAYYFTLTFIPESVRATTLYVGGAGPGNYTSIQSAIDNVSSGGTVFVFNGTYIENLRISKTLSLVGENREETIVKGSRADDVAFVSADWVNITGFTFSKGIYLGSYAGLKLHHCWGCYVGDNNLSNNKHGIHAYSSDGNTLVSNTFWNNGNGIYLTSKSDRNIVSNNTVFSNVWGIRISDSDNNTVSHNSLTENSQAIYFSDTVYNIVSANNVSMNRYGIFLNQSSNHNTITNNNVFSNTVAGISSWYSHRNVISNNSVWDNAHGIRLVADSWHNIIANNTVTGNELDGIFLLTDANAIENNTVSHNKRRGIYLEWSDANTIINNMVSDNKVGIFLRNSSDNTVASNEVRFCEITGIHLLRWDRNNVIADNTISDSHRGLDIESSQGNIITDNVIISNDELGISLTFSNGTAIDGNLVSANGHQGIQLTESDSNVIVRNSIIHNEDGIEFSSSNGNIVASNNVSMNSNIGVSLRLSHVNRFYHNSFIDNGEQARDDNEDNLFDNGYPSGGNYWSDYVDVDEKSGPGQNQSGSDGIGDTPHDIPGGLAKDLYPLIIPREPPLQPSLFCTIVDPTFGETIAGHFHIGVMAYSAEGLPEKVEVRIDDGNWTEAYATYPPSSRFWLDWDSMTLSDGEHTIYARSYDGSNYSDVGQVVVIVRNQDTRDFVLEGIWILIAVALVIAVTLSVLFILNRRIQRKEGGKQSP